MAIERLSRTCFNSGIHSLVLSITYTMFTHNMSLGQVLAAPCCTKYLKGHPSRDCIICPCGIWLYEFCTYSDMSHCWSQNLSNKEQWHQSCISHAEQASCFFGCFCSCAYGARLALVEASLSSMQQAIELSENLRDIPDWTDEVRLVVYLVQVSTFEFCIAWLPVHR